MYTQKPLFVQIFAVVYDELKNILIKNSLLTLKTNAINNNTIISNKITKMQQ